MKSSESLVPRFNAADLGMSRLSQANIIGTAVVGLDGKIHSINDYYLGVLGYSRAEFEANGLNIHTLTPPGFEDNAALRAEFHETGKVRAFERPRLRKDGSVVWTLTAYVMCENDSQLAYSWALDIDEKKRAEMLSQYLLEANQIMASSMDLEPLLGKIVAVTLVNGFCDFCTIHLPEPDGQLSCRALIHKDPARQARIRDVMRRFPRYMSDVAGPARVIRTGNSELGVRNEHAELSYLCVPLNIEGRTIGALTMTSETRNFSPGDLHTAEALAQRASQHIENAKLHEELKQSSKELKRSNKDLTHFASIAAHDLKSPLATAQSFLQTLLQDVKDSLPEEQLGFLYRSIVNLDKMRSQIDQLLAFSQVRTGKVDRREISLMNVVNQVKDNLAKDIAESGAEIRCGSLPKISGDQTLLVLLFQNLLSNSIRFRREDVPLAIEIEAEGSDSEHIISVKDNGQGFDSTQAERIFKLFEQLQESKAGGQGIGLATCRKIIETHGGRIWAESIPGKGAKFFFTLPRAPKAD